MADANGQPTLEEIRAERERRQREARLQAAAGGQPVTLEAIRAERARRAQPQPQPVGQAEDVGRSFASAVPRGFASLVALPRAIDEASANWAAQNHVFGDSDLGVGARQFLFGSPYEDDAPSTVRLPSMGEIERDVLTPTVGAPYEPQTRLGRYARAAGEFAPAALFPGSLTARASRVIVPSAASEAAGEATEGTPAEPWARLGGGLIGGIAVEANIARNAGNFRRLGQPAPEAEQLEQEFGPLTRGERSGQARQRLEEDDLRRGMGSPQAQSTMRAFDARRAQTIRENAMNVVTRGQPALSRDVGEAGTILGDEMRSARQALWSRAQAQYDEAFNLAKNEPVPPSDELGVRIDEAARENMFEVPSGAAQPLNVLQNDIRQGRATQANVERARQELSRRRTQAVNARQDADEFVYSSLIQTLDDWSAGLVRNPQAKRAMQEARGIYREMRSLYGQRGRTELGTGHTGRMDPGGRAIDRAINTDLTGEQIIDGILGTGRRPSAQTLGAVRRIKELGTETITYTNKGAASGVRAPGRTRVGGRTAGQRRFAADDPNAPASPQNPRGGMEQPTAVIQSLREGFWHRLLSPIDDYLARVETNGAREGGLLPAQRMVSQLDNALNGPGKEITAELFTAREMAAMQRLLRYFKRVVPPPGANYSGTAAALYRSITGVLQNAANAIPGLGMAISALRGASREFSSTLKAERAVAPVRPRTAPRASRMAPESPDDRAPVAAAALATQEEPRRVGGTSFAPLEQRAAQYSDEELERIAEGASEAPIDTGRPILNNEDGSFSTEQTITIESDGVFYNIPTIVNGRRVSEDEAVSLWRQGRNPEVATARSLNEALDIARGRSRRIGQVRGQEAAGAY